MSDIRTKFLGLAAVATAFAGLSYGQQITSCTAGTTLNPTLRAEGETELVADASVTCVGNTVATIGSVYASVPGATITSQKESSLTNGNSDVVLQITSGTSTSYYPGTVTGGSVSFSGVAIPGATFTATVSNVRVNATIISAPQVTETILVQYNVNGNTTTPSNVPGTAENVGYILPSLGVSLVQTSSGSNQFYGGTTSSFTTCTGSSATLGTPAFTLSIKEVIANAFKTQAQEGGSYPGTGTLGSGLASNTGVASSGTQLLVTFAGIPSAATVYLPISVTSGGTTLMLTGNQTAVTSPSSLSGQNYAAFTPSSGGITATYATTIDTSTGMTFNVPVYLVVSGGAAPVQTTAMTVSVAYTPTGTLTGLASTIPTFAASTVAPFNTLTVTPCSTTLLFPFVTNASGFETGIAIANTTSDNLKSNGSSSVTATSGTCTLNFYGNAATQPTAYTTGTVGVYAAGSPATTPVFANTLTTMGPQGFIGYAIASCNFLDAHGFAYIVDNFGTPSGTAEGYLAVVLPNGRSGNSGDGTNTGE